MFYKRRLHHDTDYSAQHSEPKIMNDYQKFQELQKL